MVTVYAIALVVAILGLIAIVFAGAVRPDSDLPDAIKLAVGAIAGFGMGGMAAEFSPLDFTTLVSFGIALGAAVVSVVWVRYAVRQAAS